jgi:hypothetical protein
MLQENSGDFDSRETPDMLKTTFDQPADFGQYRIGLD